MRVTLRTLQPGRASEVGCDSVEVDSRAESAPSRVTPGTLRVRLEVGPLVRRADGLLFFHALAIPEVLMARVRAAISAGSRVGFLVFDLDRVPPDPKGLERDGSALSCNQPCIGARDGFSPHVVLLDPEQPPTNECRYITAGKGLQVDVARFGDQHGAQTDRQIGNNASGAFADVGELVAKLCTGLLTLLSQAGGGTPRAH
jgi:hypothetical protein